MRIYGPRLVFTVRAMAGDAREFCRAGKICGDIELRAEALGERVRDALLRRLI